MADDVADPRGNRRRGLERIAAARAEARGRGVGGGHGPGLLRDRHRRHARSMPIRTRRVRRPNYKHGFGFSAHGRLPRRHRRGPGRPACARATPQPGSADDHVRLLDAALAQLPVDPTTTEVIARTDSAGCSPRLPRRLSGARRALRRGPPPQRRAGRRGRSTSRRTAGCRPFRPTGPTSATSGEVAEITDLVDLSAWPEGTRMIVRREEPHPGAQLTFTDVDGHRYQVFITDHPEDDVGFLEALYRGRGRCERRICDPRTPGSPTCPRPASPSTRPGWPWCSSPATCWPG